MRNRNHSFLIRLNDEEFAILNEKTEKSRLPREVFVRKILKDGIVREAPPADYPKLLRSLSQIGNNLNQMAATANTVHFINPRELNQAISNLKHTMKQIHCSFQIPDQKRLQEELMSKLQYLYEESKKVLDGLGQESESQDVLCFIKDAISKKSEQENKSVRRYRDSHPEIMLGFLSELYTPFQEDETVL